MSSVRPGIGFSNNIYPEIFCGTNPDQIGYFNEWAPCKKPQQINHIGVLKLFDSLWKFRYINAGIRKLILKKIFQIDHANIPFQYVKYFDRQGTHNFRKLGDKSLLQDHDFEIYDPLDCPDGDCVFKDKFIIEKAIKTDLKGKNVFVASVGIDSISHQKGIKSKPFFEHIDYLNTMIPELIAKYLLGNQGASVFVFSDHGMAKVNKFVNVDIEKEFGKMSPGKYLYFIDSTFIRFWVKDDSLKNSILEFMSSQKDGQILGDEDRIEYGVTDKNYGDIIYRANEGVAFLPNFFGGRKIRAMHGYESRLVSQQAFFADITNKSQAMPLTSSEVHSYMLKHL